MDTVERAYDRNRPVEALDVDTLARNWWAVLLRGIAGILFGIATFFAPAISLAALVLLFGAYSLVDGVFAIASAIRRRGDAERWWLLLLEGVAGVAAGVLTFIWPGITAIALLYLIAAWALVTGALEIAAAIRLRKIITDEWLLVLAGVSLAMQIVENQHFLSLLSLGRELGRAGDAAPVLAVTAPTIRASWKWAHYTHLLAVVGWMLLFCGVLFRLALVPRVLAAAGIVTTIMQLVGITLPALLGYHVPFSLAAWGVPLGIAYLSLSLWLLARGFAAGPVY